MRSEVTACCEYREFRIPSQQEADLYTLKAVDVCYHLDFVPQMTLFASKQSLH